MPDTTRLLGVLVETATLIERMRHEHAVNQRWPSFSRETVEQIQRLQETLREVLGPHECVRGDGYEMCRVCGVHVPDKPAPTLVDAISANAPLRGWGSDVQRWREYVNSYEPCPCVQCGREVERARRVYAHPTCYACLPPPPPLEICELRDARSAIEQAESGSPEERNFTPTEEELRGINERAQEMGRRALADGPPDTISTMPSSRRGRRGAP